MMSTMTIDETHDASRRSWVASANGHTEFPIQNLPFGVFSTAGTAPKLGVAIGDSVLDLAGVASHLPAAVRDRVRDTTLNGLFALPAVDRIEIRRRLSELLSDAAFKDQVEPHLLTIGSCQLHLPVTIGDYTDFYTGIHHAQNAGSLFRPDAPLQPNYKWIPIGYHGRASSVQASGAPLIRPNGQQPSNAQPLYGPTQRLDFELEMGAWVGQGNGLGEPVPIADAGDHLVGLCLLNDWSARDVQMWEMQPLGPFLAKSFMTTVSPWVVTLEALAPFRIAQPERPGADPKPLPYLSDPNDQRTGAFGIVVEAHITSKAMRDAGMAPHRLTRARMSTMYWTVAQMLAHHTSNGCNLQPGDLLGTGTISEPTDDGFGSLLEITRGGRDAVTLPSGERRTVLEDGDEVTLTGHASAAGFVPIGFGECRGLIVPAPAAR